MGRRLFQSIVPLFFSDANTFFEKMRIFLKIFLKGRVIMEKMAPHSRQKPWNTRRRGRPAVISHSSAPSPSAAV